MNKQKVAYQLTHSEEDLQERARWFSEQEDLHLVPFEKISSAGTSSDAAAAAVLWPVLKIGRSRTVLLWQGTQLFFHPSMALLRLIELKKGGNDRFLEAADLREGHTLVDATMGLAADALLAAVRVGETGRVLALEASPLIAALVKDGLRRLSQGPAPKAGAVKTDAWQELAAAAARIEVQYCRHLDFLRAQPSATVDTVYFDPMFERTRRQSAAMRPLKLWAVPEPISVEAVTEARRIARRVVLKERSFSAEFDRLGFTRWPSGRYSPVGYGIIQQEGSLTL